MAEYEGDLSDLHVNFSGEEAASEGRDYAPIPAGTYVAYVTGGEVRACGPESKNPGKPYYNIEYTIDGGPFDGRKQWSNVMLFEGALYSLTQLMKATGFGVSEGSQGVPSIDDFVGKKVKISVAMKEYPPGSGSRTNDVKSIMKADANATSGAGASKSDSLLP